LAQRQYSVELSQADAFALLSRENAYIAESYSLSAPWWTRRRKNVANRGSTVARQRWIALAVTSRTGEIRPSKNHSVVRDKVVDSEL